MRHGRGGGAPGKTRRVGRTAVHHPDPENREPDPEGARARGGVGPKRADR